MQLNKEKIQKGDTIVIASHNQGKINEFKTLLSAYKLKIITSSDLGIKDVEETGKTFKENALIKVKSIPDDLIGISDDSGLCVSNLDNRPGIYSSRFQKECGGWYNAMKKIFDEVKKKPPFNSSARFLCSLSIKFKNKSIFSYEGEVRGHLVWPPKGDNGFGYDPFFVPDGSQKTFAEMEHRRKILIDHRSVALQKLITEHLTDN